MAWELYKPSHGKSHSIKKQFMLNPTSPTRFNRLVLNGMTKIDLLYNKEQEMIGIKPGTTKKITPGRDTQGYGCCSLIGFCQKYGLEKSLWVFQFTNEQGMDIYKKEDYAAQ